jgi:hypothetical protein
LSFGQKSNILLPFSGEDYTLFYAQLPIFPFQIYTIMDIQPNMKEKKRYLVNNNNWSFPEVTCVFESISFFSFLCGWHIYTSIWCNEVWKDVCNKKVFYLCILQTSYHQLIAFSSLFLIWNIFFSIKEWNQVLPGIPLGFYTFCSQRSGSCKTTFEEQIILRFIETYPHRGWFVLSSWQ